MEFDRITRREENLGERNKRGLANMIKIFERGSMGDNVKCFYGKQSSVKHHGFLKQHIIEILQRT